MDAKLPLLLLKTKSSPSDGYEEFFENHGSFIPCFVPVLEHSFKRDSLEEIASTIESGAFNAETDRSRYGGWIFTSQRAVEAFTEVVQGLRRRNIDISTLFPPWLPFYVVGPATARGLRALNVNCPIIGEETGNGDALAAFILNHFEMLYRERPRTPRRLLFLVGEQRRDIIPRTLQSDILPENKRIGVEETIVYETGELESFPGDFKRAIEEAVQQNASRQWIVVFSPTGCKAMLEGLGLLGADGNVKQESSINSRIARIVTIGPTTQAYLRRKFNFEADVCAPAPSFEGIEKAIMAYGK